jgi:hypothetical protein
LLFFALMGVSTAGVNTLMWALEADTVEYGEWKTGVRTEGITIGLGGYVGGVAAQSESAALISMVESDRTGAAHVGVVGLAVMGGNLARNLASHGRTVALQAGGRG